MTSKKVLGTDCITDEVLELEAHRDKMAEMLLKLCNVLGSVAPRQVTHRLVQNYHQKIKLTSSNDGTISLFYIPGKVFYKNRLYNRCTFVKISLDFVKQEQ